MGYKQVGVHRITYNATFVDQVTVPQTSESRHELVPELEDLGAGWLPQWPHLPPSCLLALLLDWNLLPCPSCRGIYSVRWHRSLCVKEDAASYPRTQWAGP